mgnify:CR=1 FL=1
MPCLLSSSHARAPVFPSRLLSPSLPLALCSHVRVRQEELHTKDNQIAALLHKKDNQIAALENALKAASDNQRSSTQSLAVCSNVSLFPSANLSVCLSLSLSLCLYE